MKIIVFVLTFLSISFYGFCQDFDISEANRINNEGMYNSYLIELEGLDKDHVVKDWEKFVKDFKSKVKYSRKSKLHSAEDVKMPRLSENPVGVSAQIHEVKTKSAIQTSIVVWFDLGNEYLSTGMDSIKSAYAQILLREFALNTSKSHAELIVKSEEKRFDHLSKDLKKLKKSNNDYHKAINKAKESIAKNEKNIEINELDQKNKVREIEAQQMAIETAKEKVKVFNN